MAEALISKGQGLVRTTPKTREHRVISLPPFLRDALDAHLGEFTEAGTGPKAVVFSGLGGSLQAHSNFARDVFRPAVLAALPAEKHGLRFHDLRHTCAALLIAAGAHPKLVSTRLGQSSIAITMSRYGHLLPSLDEAVTAGLEATLLATTVTAAHST